jgi:hypothetical protein
LKYCAKGKTTSSKHTSMADQLEVEKVDRIELLAEQAVRTRGGRRLLIAAVRDLAQGNPKQRWAIREIGAHICQLTNAHTLREIASDIAADGKASSLVAHDELLSGFWCS